MSQQQAEVINKLKSTDNISIHGILQLSQDDIDNIINPMFKWIEQLKLLNKFNFTITIYNMDADMKVVLAIGERGLNTLIPEYVKNISIDYIPTIEKIQLRSMKSLLESSSPYKYNEYITLCTENKLYAGIEFYKYLENLVIQRLEEFNNEVNQRVDDRNIELNTQIIQNSLTHMLNNKVCIHKIVKLLELHYQKINKAPEHDYRLSCLAITIKETTHSLIEKDTIPKDIKEKSQYILDTYKSIVESLEHQR